MISIDKYRIISLDKINLTYQELREVENKKDKSKRLEWVTIGGYYGNLSSALNSLKNYIVNEFIMNDTTNNIVEFLTELDGLFVKCDIKPEFEGKLK